MRLLLIILLFPFVAFSQVSISEYAVGYQTSGIGSISSYSYNAGNVYIIFAGTTNTTTPATVSLSGGGTTWTEIGNIVSDGSTMRLQAFMFKPLTNVTTAITVTYTGSQTGGFVVGYLIQGSWTNSPTIQVVTDAQDGVANPSITMGALASSESAVLAGFINDSNPFGGTAEAGWTETEDGGYATPNTGGYVMYRLNTTDNTPTVTAASGNWAGIAIEFRKNRRIFCQ